MRKLNKAISAIISVCFIVNSAITDIAIGQDLFRHDDSATLAASSRCDDINGPELAEITKVKCALMAQLLTMAGEGKSIDSLDFSELVRKASAYNNSVFSLSDVQTFIHESDAASNGLPAGYRCVMCRVKDPLAGFANKPLRIYYAVFALERDSLGGFPIYVYKENEYARFLKAGTLASLPRREASVENAISRNIAHQVSARSGEKAVDEFISERIKAGDFTEFEGRANELLWNYRGTFPDRKKWSNYRFLPSVRFQAVWGRLHPFLAHLDIGFQEALNSRNIVFIRVPEGVKYPVIHERDPASGKDMPVSVRSHTSENCVYIFLDDETFSAMVNGNNVSDSELLGLIVHEIGVIYGLPLSVVNSHGGASIVNDLDLAYAAYTSTMHANLDDEAALLAIDAVMKDSPALKNIRYAPEKAPLGQPAWRDPATGKWIQRDYAAGGPAESPAALVAAAVDRAKAMGLEITFRRDILLSRPGSNIDMATAREFAETHEAIAAGLAFMGGLANQPDVSTFRSAAFAISLDRTDERGGIIKGDPALRKALLDALIAVVPSRTDDGARKEEEGSKPRDTIGVSGDFKSLPFFVRREVARFGKEIAALGNINKISAARLRRLIDGMGLKYISTDTLIEVLGSSDFRMDRSCLDKDGGNGVERGMAYVISLKYTTGFFSEKEVHTIPLVLAYGESNRLVVRVVDESSRAEVQTFIDTKTEYLARRAKEAAARTAYLSDNSKSDIRENVIAAPVNAVFVGLMCADRIHSAKESDMIAGMRVNSLELAGGIERSIDSDGSKTASYLEKLPPEVRAAISDYRRLQSGGPTTSSARVCALLAGRDQVAIDEITSIGADGEPFVKAHEAVGIRMKAQRSDSLPTASTLIFELGKGDRAFLHNIGASAELTVDKLKREDFLGKKIAEFGGVELMPNLMKDIDKALEMAKGAGCMTVFDTVVDKPRQWREHFVKKARFDRLMGLIDVFTPSIEEARQIMADYRYPNDEAAADRLKNDKKELTPEKVVAFFMRHGAKAVFLKDGKNGAYIGTAEDSVFKKKTMFHIPIFRGFREVSGTGTGDAFAGALVYALSRGWDPVKSAMFADVVGGMCVQYNGGTIGDETLADALYYMERLKAQMLADTLLDPGTRQEARDIMHGLKTYEPGPNTRFVNQVEKELANALYLKAFPASTALAPYQIERADFGMAKHGVSFDDIGLLLEVVAIFNKGGGVGHTGKVLINAPNQLLIEHLHKTVVVFDKKVPKNASIPGYTYIRDVVPSFIGIEAYNPDGTAAGMKYPDEGYSIFLADSDNSRVPAEYKDKVIEEIEGKSETFLAVQGEGVLLTDDAKVLYYDKTAHGADYDPNVIPPKWQARIDELKRIQGANITTKGAIYMKAGTVVLLPKGTKHAFLAGDEGAVYVEFSGPSLDPADDFTDRRVVRLPDRVELKDGIVGAPLEMIIALRDRVAAPAETRISDVGLAVSILNPAENEAAHKALSAIQNEGPQGKARVAAVHRSVMNVLLSRCMSIMPALKDDSIMIDAFGKSDEGDAEGFARIGRLVSTIVNYDIKGGKGHTGRMVGNMPHQYSPPIVHSSSGTFKAVYGDAIMFVDNPDIAKLPPALDPYDIPVGLKAAYNRAAAEGTCGKELEGKRMIYVAAGTEIRVPEGAQYAFFSGDKGFLTLEFTSPVDMTGVDIPENTATPKDGQGSSSGQGTSSQIGEGEMIPVSGRAYVSPIQASQELGPFDCSLIQPTISNEEMWARLDLASERGQRPGTRGYYRAVDIGSSCDLIEWQQKYTRPGTVDIGELPCTTIICSGIRGKITISRAANDNAIEYVAEDFGISADDPFVVEGEVPLTEGLVPGENKQLYAPAYIFRNIFKRRGIRITYEIDESDPAKREVLRRMVKAGGFGTSAGFNESLVRIANVVSGAGRSDADCTALAIRVENNELAGLTGGQEHFAFLLGGIAGLTWLSGLKDAGGRFVVPYGAFARDIVPADRLVDVQRHIMLAQAGKEYKNGKAQIVRTAKLINDLWTDLVRFDPESQSLFAEIVELGIRGRDALARGDYGTLVQVLDRHADIRDENCRRWMSLMLEARLNRPAASEAGRMFADKVFNPANKYYRYFEPIRDFLKPYLNRLPAEDSAGYNTACESIIRTVVSNSNFYTGGPINALMKAARKKGICVFAAGAGGWGANLFVISSKADPVEAEAELRAFFAEPGDGIEPLPQFTPDNVKVVDGTGVLRGYMPFEIGREPMEFVGWEGLGFDIPEPEPSRNPVDSGFLESMRRAGADLTASLTVSRYGVSSQASEGEYGVPDLSPAGERLAAIRRPTAASARKSASEHAAAIRPFDEVFGENPDDAGLRIIYDMFVDKARAVDSEMRGRYGDSAIAIDTIGVVPGGDPASNMVVVNVNRHTGKRRIGIFQCYLEGICRRLYSMMDDRYKEHAGGQMEAIRSLIEASIYHEWGHGFEKYSGMDIDSLMSDDAAVSEFSALMNLGLDPKKERDRVRIAEALADTMIGGKGNARYVENKGAYIFYKFISAYPENFIDPDGNVLQHKIMATVESYFRRYPHMAKIHGPDDIGRISDTVVSYYKLFFGPGTYWYGKFFAGRLAAAPDEGAEGVSAELGGDEVLTTRDDFRRAIEAVRAGGRYDGEIIEKQGHTLIEFTDMKEPGNSFTVMVDKGFRVISWTVAGKERLLVHESLETLGGGIFSMFPWVNRLNGGRCKLDGADIDINDTPGLSRDGGNPIHGVSRIGVWKDFTIGEDSEGVFISASFETADYDPKLAKKMGRSKLKKTYHMIGNSLITDVYPGGKGISDVGEHPFVRYTPGSTELQADVTAMFPVDGQKIRTGGPGAVPADKDFTSPKPLTPNVDNTFRVRADAKGVVTAKIIDHAEGVTTTFRYSGIFSAKPGEEATTHFWGGKDDPTSPYYGVGAAEGTEVASDGPNWLGEVGGSRLHSEDEVRHGRVVMTVETNKEVAVSMGASAEMSEDVDERGGGENRDVDLGGPDGEAAMERLARNAMASAKSAEALNALKILAAAAGKEFPTRPDTRYTLLTPPEFFANGELRERQARYGDRFYLDQVTGRTPGEFVTNVIGHHLANRDRTIVLVPDEFAEGRLEAMHLETLKAAGIRFILASRNELLSARSAAKDNPARAAYVDNTLGAMYAYRHATTLDRTSGIYSILEFYAANRLALGGITADRYIEAVVKGDVNVLIKVFLKPMLPVDAEEDHRRVTHALIFA